MGLPSLKLPVVTLGFLLLFIPISPPATGFAEPFALEKIIVEGDSLPPSEDAPGDADLRHSAAKDMAEALGEIEGLHFVRKGAIANDVVLRGFGRDNVNLLIDGARIYGACPNRMDPAAFHVDFAEIETARILRGPFDVRNAGSFGGMINVHTAAPEPGRHFLAKTTIGSNQEISAAARASTAWKNGSLLAGYAYKYALPYKDARGDRITAVYPDDAPNRYLPEQIDERAYRINSYWGKFGASGLSGHRMEISVARQEAEDVIYPYLLMDAEYDDTNRANWIYEIDPPADAVDHIRFQLYWNNVEHDMTDARRASSLKSQAAYSMRTFAENETYGGKTAIECRTGAGRLALGADGYVRNWHARTTLPTGTQDSIPDVETGNAGAFAELVKPLSRKLSLTAGVRVDTWRTKARKNRKALYAAYYDTADTSRDSTNVSGNLQLHYQPNDGITFFAGVGRSVRPPDPLERYFALVKPMAMPNWVGNPGLSAPKNHEADIGVRCRTAFVEAKTTLFYSAVDDFITVVNLAGTDTAKPARSYANADAIMYGGEAAIQLRLPAGLMFNGHLAYTYGRNEDGNSPLAEIPPLEARTALRRQGNGWFAELEGEFNDRQDRVDDRLNESSTPGWGIANITAGISLNGVDFTAGLQNIFDKYYVRHLSFQRDPFRSGVRIPEMGRNVFFMVSGRL